MIAPSSTNLEVPPRVPFTPKPKLFDQPDRRSVARLNVCFDAVQPERTEHLCQNTSERRLHVTAPGEGHTNVVTQIGAAELASDDLTEFNGAHDRSIRSPHDQPIAVIG